MTKIRIQQFLWRHAVGIALTVMVLFVAGIGYLGYNYVLITRKFDSARRWDLPSRIYSDAMPIVPGLSYTRDLLEPKLNHLGYHATTAALSMPGEYRYVGNNLEIYLQDFAYPDMEFHAYPVRIVFDSSSTVTSVQRLPDGVPLRAIRLEPELITSVYGDVMEDRIPVPLNSVPKYLVDAIIATEDRSFYHHEGISIRGMIRAEVSNLRAGKVHEGGSTLTQQLVKNLYLDPSRRYSRKIREIIMAVMLEARYSKQQILEAYINEIYLGQNGSVQINGFEEASRVYFSKHVNYLTLPEAATLAGMIHYPNGLTPLRYPDRAVARRNFVLKGMLDQSMITNEQYQAAIVAPMTVNQFPKSYGSAPFFVDLVMKQLREKYPETQLRTEGLRVFTTLDTIMQRAAEESLQQGVLALAKKYAHIRRSATPLEGAVVTVEPGTGYVKALVGGRDYTKSQFNRAFQAARQPGSLFKPFVYIAAMDPARGEQALTASTILDDSPIAIQSGTTTWRPQNYDNRFHGLVPLRRALAMSYNIPAVRAAIDAGVPNVVKMAARVGVRSRLEAYPSIALGSFEVTPLEIAYAYSVFANEGVKAEPISILAVVTADGKLLENRQVTMQRVAPPGICYVMNDILKGVLDYGTAARIRSLGFTRHFSGKSGTTNSYRDAWFIGYSPRILSLVWVGFDDGHNVGLAGGEAAMPIWAGYMKRVVGMIPDTDFRRPADVVDREIDPESGLLATPSCPQTANEIYVEGTEPTAVCNLHGTGYDSAFPVVRNNGPWESEPDSIPAAEADRNAAREGQQNADWRQGKKERRIKHILRMIFGGQG